jgi:hypothetical protein
VTQHREAWTEHIERRFKGEAEAKAKPFKLQPVEPRESAVLASILQALAFYPKVAWWERVNNGAYTVGEGSERRYIRFGFTGCSDIIGQMKPRREGDAGAFLAIEVKRPSGATTEAQDAFLEMVRTHGGVAFVARSVDDLREYLA